MPKDIFYIAKEMCNKCWKQLMQSINKIKNNDSDNINDLMFCQYNNENEINTITTDTVLVIKCRNKFYALFWKQDLLKSKDASFEDSEIKPEHVAEVLAFNKMLAKGMTTASQSNNSLYYFNNERLTDVFAADQKLAIKNVGSSSYPIANSDQQLVQIKDSKRKVHRWVWIILAILLLILLAGGGAIGYEFYRISARTSLINSNIIGDDGIEIDDDGQDQIIKDDNADQIQDNKEGQDQDGKDSKDGQDQVIKDNKDDQDDKDNQIQDNKDEQDQDNQDSKEIQKQIQDIDISKYSFDFTQNKSNLIEVDKLEINLIKPKLLKLEDVSDSLQNLFKNNNLKIVLAQEHETLAEKDVIVVNLQLDATELEGYTGQAILRLAVKIKQEVLNGAIQIKGITNLNKGVNDVYETTNFKKHFEPLLNLYEKPVKFTVETWTGYLPTLGLPLALSQNQKNVLMSALNERYLPTREIVQIRKNGNIQNLRIQWIFSKENNKDKIIELMPYASEQPFDQSHFQLDFKYNLKIKYTENIT